MYDINTKNVKKGKNFYFIFLAFGIFFMIVMGWILVSDYIKLHSLDSTTTSTKVIVKSYINDEGATMYSPIYYYEVNRRTYSCSSNSSSSINPGTANETVYYDSKNPSNCMTEYSKSSNNLLLIFMIIPLIAIAVAGVNIRKVNKRVRSINKLNKTGKLVKNLPYHLENSGIIVNGVQIQRPVIDYTLPSGNIITLYGDPRHDHIVDDDDGMVDLVIDENNPQNYFIDFEINRLTGNLATDYYNDVPNNQATVNQTIYTSDHQQSNFLNNDLNITANNNFQQTQVQPQNTNQNDNTNIQL